MSPAIKPRVLYIASGGIRHPLIVSQVVRYLKQLNATYERCDLVTFERERIESDEASTISRELVDAGIHWHGLPSYPGFRVFNIWREIWNGYSACLSLIRENNLNLIHARSFIPGNIGLRLARKTGTKFLYDMRGFWTEEKYSKGTIQHHWIKRQAQRMEDRLFHQADALVSLSYAGKNYLRDQGVQTSIDVIPCCCDTDLFCPPEVENTDSEIHQLIAAGSLGPGYLPESVFGIFAAVQEINPDCKLELLSRTGRESIEQIAQSLGCDMSKIRLHSVGPEQVADYLRASSVGLVLNQSNFDKIACCPTKLAESLACGLPVFANCNGIGDMTAILSENRVGVAVEDQSVEGWQRAAHQMNELLKDKALRQRCRDLANRRFSVKVGVKSYAQIYERLVSS